MAQRIVLAFVALVAAAWLAVAFRDARLQASGLELARLPVERLDVRRIERYLREEPDNRDAWGILSAATSRTQPALSRRALRRFRQLGSTAVR
jgi:hypothetical protein